MTTSTSTISAFVSCSQCVSVPLNITILGSGQLLRVFASSFFLKWVSSPLTSLKLDPWPCGLRRPSVRRGEQPYLCPTRSLCPAHGHYLRTRSRGTRPSVRASHLKAAVWAARDSGRCQAYARGMRVSASPAFNVMFGQSKPDEVMFEEPGLPCGRRVTSGPKRLVTGTWFI